ncbi:uncharacterized protein N7496_010877 [Penicillium cataractarum]|uniref:Uncharacterized protein n=1 Tax=Penicillium cataractarum TaxID=2100454 RepID=A0A9W9UVU7_9EURO|nr:uncharacterized protein N7496_010877 [Penicillium cataractarum]KAJ5358464.1 hypothetical protein N7496_010877 [Penicillium cataractarum]
MAAAAPPLPYGLHQTRGRTLQSWIEDPSVAKCHIKPCNITYQDLLEWAPVDESFDDPDSEDEEVTETVERLDVEGPLTMHVVTSEDGSSSPGGSSGDWNDWRSFVADGSLFIMTMFRASGYHASEIAQALYTRAYPIETLKHVFAIDVANEDTRTFIKRQIYTDGNGLAWPASGSQSFARGTAEYEGLLGTRIGSVVAYLLLGAFTRGTHRISKISIEVSATEIMSLQFDIEDIKPPPKKKRRRSRDDGDGDGGGRGGGEGRPKKRRRYIDENYDGPAKRTRLAVRRKKAGAAKV